MLKLNQILSLEVVTLVTFAILLMGTILLGGRVLEEHEHRILVLETGVRFNTQSVKALSDVYRDDASSLEYIVKVSRAIASIEPSLSEDQTFEFARHIVNGCRGTDVDPFLVLAVIRVESHFNSDALGKAGEVGLMQIMEFWTGHFNLDQEGLFDPRTNVRVGAAILDLYLRQCSGELVCALNRYNGYRGSGSSAYAAEVLATYHGIKY